MTPFGRHPGVLAPELAQQAILKAVDDAGVRCRTSKAVYCANVLGGMILGQLIVRDLGLRGIPSTTSRTPVQRRHRRASGAPRAAGRAV